MIKKVLEDFINCWKVFNGYPMMSVDHAAAQINRGDCGLAAIATHYVLRECFNINTKIVLNRNHCWQMLDDVDYDTLNPAGYPTEKNANQHWSRFGEDPVNVLSFKEACDEWMPCDSHGAYLVLGFVSRYNLPMPTELQHCIDRAADYECQEVIPGFIAKSNQVRNIPIAV